MNGAVPEPPTAVAPSMRPVTEPSAWTGADLERDRSWEFFLSPEQQNDLEDALRQVQRQGLRLAEVTREGFPLPALADTLRAIQHQLRDGRGMVVLHGVPTAGHELDALEKLYWGLNTHLGTGVTQNSEVGLLHYVTDGKLRPQQGTRGVGNPGRVNLHVDLADCVDFTACARRRTTRTATSPAR